MKIKFTTLLVATLCLSSIAQVEIEKSKSTLTGKNSVLVESIPESILDHFNINFYNYFYGGDSGGSTAKGTHNTVTIEAELDIDNQLAQQITDEAYSYFLEKWKARGITLRCPTAAEIEATKQFTKDKGKGKAELLAPGTYTYGNNFAKYITVIPANAPQVRKEYYGNFVLGNSQFFPTDFKGNTSAINFHMDVNFISFRNGFGTNASVTGKAGLKSNSAGSIVLWAKTKNLAASYTNEGLGGSDSFDDFEKGAKWKVKINKEKYKANVLEMIKKSIDSQLAEYDADVAKEKK